MSQKVSNRFRSALILIREITITDFKLRYHDSFLGYLWSVLRPLALFTILYIVFAKVFQVGDAIPHYPVYLLMGLVIWNYFTEASSTCLAGIVEKGDLMRKISFPKYIVIVSKITSALINLSINFVIVAVFMLLFGTSLSPWAILVVPLLIAELLIFTLGLGLIFGSLYVRLRDLNYIWEVIVQALFYATPILYPLEFVVENFSKRFAQVLMLNPIAQILQDLRLVLVTPQTSGYGDIISNGYIRIVPISITILTLVVGIWYFRKRSKYFAEYI